MFVFICTTRSVENIEANGRLMRHLWNLPSTAKQNGPSAGMADRGAIVAVLLPPSDVPQTFFKRPPLSVGRGRSIRRDCRDEYQIDGFKCVRKCELLATMGAQE